MTLGEILAYLHPWLLEFNLNGFLILNLKFGINLRIIQLELVTYLEMACQKNEPNPKKNLLKKRKKRAVLPS